jgi:hypothetical protein
MRAFIGSFALAAAASAGAETLPGVATSLRVAEPPSRTSAWLPPRGLERVDTAPRRRLGLIAGREVSPGMTVGLGLYEAPAKVRLNSERRIDGRVKRTRKPGVGLTLKF